MRILKIEISNYRNLNGVKVFFDKDCNFLVGENNIGKSNILNLCNILFNSRGFQFDDFHDPSLPIEIHLELSLDDVELGHFQDLFDMADYSIVNVVARQLSPEENLTYHHFESDTFISPAMIRCINYVHYDSLRNPISEINFDKGKGAGRFLRSIISKYLVDSDLTDSQFLDEEKINTLLSAINGRIKRIKSFDDFGIKALQDQDAENVLSKIVVLQDAKGKSLTKAGYGVQFLILVVLSILEKLQSLRQYRGDKGIFENEEDGSKAISLVLGLDEPEIHLHPYMQRALIKYLGSVISNENEEFKTLIKELFGIDRFVGQIIIVTHSPNIILNNYKQIQRLYTEDDATRVISGQEVNLSEQLHKHLLIQFPFIKEAFFSRCAIFVEGDSDYSSVPMFAKKMRIEFDDLGICIVQARGSAVDQLMKLASAFKIPSVGISDRDNGTFTPTITNHLMTTQRDFEAELVSLIDMGKESVLRAILIEFDSEGVNRTMNSGALTKHAHYRYGIGVSQFTRNIRLSDIPATGIDDFKAFYLTWFSINKGYPLGYLIGTIIEENDIPAIYKSVITAAKELV